MRVRVLWTWLLAAMVAGSLGCAPAAHREGATVSDAEFDKVTLGGDEEYPCSPRIDTDSFRGIAIAMPRHIAASRLDRVPVCGSFAFTPEQFAKLPELPLGLTFVVRNIDSNEAWHGRFRSHRDLPEPDSGAARASETAADPGIVAISGNFNVNLVPSWEPPARPARYRVVFTVNEWSSAPVDFEVVK